MILGSIHERKSLFIHRYAYSKAINNRLKKIDIKHNPSTLMQYKEEISMNLYGIDEIAVEKRFHQHILLLRVMDLTISRKIFHY